jgi:hypothetical protein
MTSNEKSLNYKVVYLVEIYNFYINFILIRVYIKKLWFFEEKLSLSPWETAAGTPPIEMALAVLQYPYRRSRWW